MSIQSPINRWQENADRAFHAADVAAESGDEVGAEAPFARGLIALDKANALRREASEATE